MRRIVSSWLEALPAIDTLSSITIGLAIMVGLIPLILYVVLLGNVPTLPASAALDRLGNDRQEAALIDVRSVQAYQERHIAGASFFPLPEIQNLEGASDLPQALQGKTLLLVCDSGWLSAQAARRFGQLHISVYSIRGGIQDWGRAWPQFENNSFSNFVLKGGVIQLPYRVMPTWEQAAAALALLWIKPIYMLLSAVIAFFLLRMRPHDLHLMGWALLVFLLGEVACAINYMLLKDNSYLAEYLHSYSMALAFGLAAYALLEGLDERLIHFSQADRRCALLPVCGPCVKYQAVRCGIRRIAQLACLVMIVLAIIPLLSPFSYTAYNTQIGPVNHYYVRPIVHQWFEARYSPAVAIGFFSLALLVMLFTPQVTIHPLARVLLCGGIGFFGFSLFRVTLGLIYAEALVWATFWEELTELMFVVAVIFILWVFRRTLVPGINLPLIDMKRTS